MEMMPSQQKEEENYCGNTHTRAGLFNDAVPTESPLPQQDSPGVEDVYV